MNDALLQSAVRAHQAGNLAEAARLYSEVLRANPRHFPAMYAMGFLHYQIGRFEEASRIIGDALRINPRSPEAFFTRGCALQRLNRAAEALVCFDSALALKPDLIEAQNNRGMALMALNRDEQALESIELALALDPSNAGAWNNRGCVLEKSGRHEEALACFGKAIAIQPRSVDALINHGSALASLKRFEDAAADFAKALAIEPEHPYAQGNLVLFRMHACHWRHFARDKAEIAAALRAGKRAIYPFVNAALSDSMAEQLQCARIWAANDAPASPTPLWRGETYRHERIRLAYVSADFHAHATVALAAGVFESHDRNRFETIAISFGKDDKSDMRARVHRAFDRFIDVCPIGPHLRHIGPREHATLRARMPRASRHVVGVEQIRELRIEDLIARQMRHQQKLFKKPGRVGAMPLRRAGIGHRLNNLVFRIQRRGATFRLAAERVKGLRPRCPRIVSGRRPGTAHGRNVAPVNLGDTRKCCRRRHASPYAYGFTRRQKATT